MEITHMLHHVDEDRELIVSVSFEDGGGRVALFFTLPELREAYHYLGDLIDKHASTPRAARIESIPFFTDEQIVKLGLVKPEA